MGKIPALTHGRQVVTDARRSARTWLTRFRRPAWLRRRAIPNVRPYYRWLFFAAGPVEAATSNKAAGFEAPPERARMMGYGTYATTVDTLEKAVSNGYLAGGRFSAADLYVGSQLNCGMRFGSIEKRPAFERYVARC